jgi:hypothetical protein
MFIIYNIKIFPIMLKQKGIVQIDGRQIQISKEVLASNLLDKGSSLCVEE